MTILYSILNHREVSMKISKYITHPQCFFPDQIDYEIKRLESLPQLSQTDQQYLDKLYHKKSVNDLWSKLRKIK
jgi:hypothetical protein